ncbi:MAG: prepilin-type N-terminal cleavage/methylation domain-containing protein, partial [Granulosicoccus sp.]|nr:prepilin-type N-terminal cleavage/methylation domain-containing protein [Granulosicoccus sp.]
MTTSNHSNRTRSGKSATRTIAGFSMVELLVAMAIGLILISGMISVFGGNRRSSELNQAMSNMQESARFAIDAISR